MDPINVDFTRGKKGDSDNGNDSVSDVYIPPKNVARTVKWEIR